MRSTSFRYMRVGRYPKVNLMANDEIPLYRHEDMIIKHFRTFFNPLTEGILKYISLRRALPTCELRYLFI